MKFRIPVALLMFVLFFAMCKKDSETAKDYLPVSAGSTFTYRFTIDSAYTSAHTYTIGDDTSYNGRTYKKFVSADTTTEFYTRAGAAYFRLASIPALGVNNYENNYLNGNTDINATWKDSVAVNNPLGLPPTVNIVFTYKIEEKGITRTVNGASFSNVIHVKLTDGSVEGLVAEMATGDFYYAQGIGLIESSLIVKDNPTFGISEHSSLQQLISYNIK